LRSEGRLPTGSRPFRVQVVTNIEKGFHAYLSFRSSPLLSHDRHGACRRNRIGQPQFGAFQQEHGCSACWWSRLRGRKRWAAKRGPKGLSILPGAVGLVRWGNKASLQRQGPGSVAGSSGVGPCRRRGHTGWGRYQYQPVQYEIVCHAGQV